MSTKMKSLFLFLAMFFAALSGLKAQSKVQVLMRYEIINGDTVLYYTLDNVNVEANRNSEEYKRYMKLIRDVKRTLPYAKLAAFRLQLMEQNLALMTSEKAKKEYVKLSEKAMMDEFESHLKKMTITQGRILLKLIHRETGSTPYTLVKNYRGSTETFFWQSMARLFGSTLKSSYDPVVDYEIENIIKSFNLD
jgi:hypothetical protein